MGEFDKCHMSMGILDDLGSNFGINSYYFAVYVYIFPITVLALSSFDCRFVCVEPSFRRKARN